MVYEMKSLNCNKTHSNRTLILTVLFSFIFLISYSQNKVKKDDLFYVKITSLKPEMTKDEVRKVMGGLSKEFDFEIIFDTDKVTTHDYGFRFKYDNTVVSVHPYTIKKNNLYIRSFSISTDLKRVIQKLKKIPNFNEREAFRTLELKDDKVIKIITPEFLLADLESKDSTNKEIIEMLYKISDKKLLKIVKRAILKTEITIKEEEIKPRIFDQNVIIIGLVALSLLILILMLVF